jgi:hypothetical protein
MRVPIPKESAMLWGLRNIILNDSITTDLARWVQEAERDGYFLWATAFPGSRQDYERLQLTYEVLDQMFNTDQFLIEVRDDMQYLLFESASDAILFRFAMAEQTA